MHSRSCALVYNAFTAITQCNAKCTHMQTFNLALAQQALLLASNNVLTAAQVQALLANASVTFAQITYVTKVQTAAQHKHNNVQKATCANVILCSNIAAHTSVYARKVRKSAQQFTQNNAQAVQNFTAQSNYFVHTNCYSIVQHAQHASKFYLYAIYNNNNKSFYFINNAVATKQQVAALLTASAAQQLLQSTNVVHNKTHNIVHNVTVRTIALSNIVSIKARKQLLTIA